MRAWVTGLALRRTRQLAGMRETHKDYLVRVLAHARAQLAILGAELAGRGLLAAADDVFFLELREVAAALDGADQRALVADRRAEYDRELRRRHIPRVLLSDGTEPEAEHAAPAPEGALVGRPGLGGHRHGRRAGGARPGGRPPRAGRDPRRPRPPTPAGPRCSSPRAGW